MGAGRGQKGRAGRIAMLPGVDSILQGKENYFWRFQFCFEVGCKYGPFRVAKGLGMRASKSAPLFLAFSVLF